MGALPRRTRRDRRRQPDRALTAALRLVETPDDRAAAALLAREFGDWATEQIRDRLGIVVPPELDHRVEVLDDIRASGGRLYLALVDEEPMGVGGLKLLGAATGEIKRMFVRPQARGHGLGRAIVERLVADARELGCEAVVLESASFMDDAHALYRSVGFVDADDYAGREFGGEPHDVSIFMRLDLA